jgi:hypothetical protein
VVEVIDVKIIHIHKRVRAPELHTAKRGISRDSLSYR